MGSGCSSDCMNGLTSIPSELENVFDSNCDSDSEIDLEKTTRIQNRKFPYKRKKLSQISQIIDLSVAYTCVKQELDQLKITNHYLKQDLEDKTSDLENIKETMRTLTYSK
jgi:predicted nuclease with TOPRIM domain